MKITWFGGRTLRVHIGGGILVLWPEASDEKWSEELLSGADTVIRSMSGLSQFDGAAWRPRRLATALEEENAAAGIEIHAVGADGALIDARGEAPLLIVGETVPAAGRWAREAVAVVFSEWSPQVVLDGLGPRLIALAMDEEALDAAFAALRERLGDTALVALEPGMAVEV